MALTEGERLPRLAEMLEPVLLRAVEDKETLEELYSAFNPSVDVRVTTFAKIINTLVPTHLGLMFLSEQMLDTEWWWHPRRTLYRSSNIAIILEEFENFLKVSMVTILLSDIESSMRNLLRALDPLACNRGAAEFKSIYENLLKSKLSHRPTQGIQLLDLLRLIRNTIHNNGVYFHKSGTDASVEWNGRRFEFKHNAALDFVTWELIIEVSDAVRELMCMVIADPVLQAITCEIGEPA